MGKKQKKNMKKNVNAGRLGTIQVPPQPTTHRLGSHDSNSGIQQVTYDDCFYKQLQARFACLFRNTCIFIYPAYLYHC